ncbi:UTP--glucose-1-phosphate uridylyltransferase [Candidatus Margulisiibacteriota bacterium]
MFTRHKVITFTHNTSPISNIVKIPINTNATLIIDAGQLGRYPGGGTIVDNDEYEKNKIFEDFFNQLPFKIDSQTIPVIRSLDPKKYIENNHITANRHAYNIDNLVIDGVKPLDPDEIEILKDEEYVVKYEAIQHHHNKGLKHLHRLINIILFGGRGTAMGLERAKGLLVIKDSKDGKRKLRIVDIRLENFRRFLAHEMASAKKKEKTFCTFAVSNHTAKDLDECIENYSDIFDEQNEYIETSYSNTFFPRLIKIDNTYRPEGEDDTTGHAETLLSLFKKNPKTKKRFIDEYIENGKDIAFLSNIDNTAARIDPAILGYMIGDNKKDNIPFIAEAARRTEAHKKGGFFAINKKTGKIMLIERAMIQRKRKKLDANGNPERDEHDNIIYESYIPEAFQKIGDYKYFNTNNIWVNLRALRDAIDKCNNHSELHTLVSAGKGNRKNEISLENAVGQLIEIFDNLELEGFSKPKIIEVGHTRFSPIKTVEDLLAMISDAYIVREDIDFALVVDETHKKYRGQPNINLHLKDGPLGDIVKNSQVGFSEMFDIDNAGFDNIPSLVLARLLDIKGAFHFRLDNLVIEDDVYFIDCRDIKIEYDTNEKEEQIPIRFGNPFIIDKSIKALQEHIDAKGNIHLQNQAFIVSKNGTVSIIPLKRARLIAEAQKETTSRLEEWQEAKTSIINGWKFNEDIWAVDDSRNDRNAIKHYLSEYYSFNKEKIIDTYEFDDGKEIEFTSTENIIPALRHAITKGTAPRIIIMDYKYGLDDKGTELMDAVEAISKIENILRENNIKIVIRTAHTEQKAIDHILTIAEDIVVGITFKDDDQPLVDFGELNRFIEENILIPDFNKMMSNR